MIRHGWVVLGRVAVMAAGCGPTAEQQRAMDMRKCSGFGFAPGTDGFANCMMNVTQQREAIGAADRRAAAQAQNAAIAARDQKSAASAGSGLKIPDLSKMHCKSQTGTTGSANNSTATTKTSCHN